jgi:hypothetical protein
MCEAISAVINAIVSDLPIDAQSSQNTSLPILDVPNKYSRDGGRSLGTTYQVRVLVGEKGETAKPKIKRIVINVKPNLNLKLFL